MMTKEQNAEAICERLIALGFAKQNRIRMYGEEFELISNPFVDEDGFGVHAVSNRSGGTRRLCIPLSILQAAMREIEGPHVDAA